MSKIYRTSKPYKTLIGWQEVEDYNRRDGARLISKIAIGELRENSQTTYIFEDIYTDILENLKENFHLYRVHVKLGNCPQLIITMNDTLIIHNPDMKQIIKRAKEIIAEIPQEYIVNAYIEMRLNNENKTKLGNATSLMMSMINEVDNTRYPVPFIQSIVKEYIEQTFFDISDSSIKEYIRSLDYKEMLLVVGEMHRYKALGKMKDEFLMEKISSNEMTIKNLESIIGKELIYRLYTGSLIGR